MPVRAADHAREISVTDPAHRLQRWEQRVEWPLATVAGIFLIAYSIQVLAEPQGHAEQALHIITTVAWTAFAAEYFVRLALASNRSSWFFHHLFDLAMVALPFLRPLRLLRLLVLFGVLQKAIGGAIRGRVVVYTAFSATLLIYVASLAILETERYEPDSKITTFGDAVWWSITTVTTVGYGDLAPVSGVGRVIAVLLMIGGISVVGIVTATLASWIIQRVADEDAANRSATTAELTAFRSEVAERMEAMHAEIRRLTAGTSEPRRSHEGNQPYGAIDPR
jgi:voltage-gated potassium channel